MLATGAYKNGQISLDKELPVKSATAKVMVTWVDDSFKEKKNQSV